ncbi:hypothetical protein Mapa_003630 [Marchantia paleacea]|nr:hypothetical protein Mapa_003630 [Marchantia paleacea]
MDDGGGQLEAPSDSIPQNSKHSFEHGEGKLGMLPPSLVVSVELRLRVGKLSRGRGRGDGIGVVEAAASVVGSQQPRTQRELRTGEKVRPELESPIDRLHGPSHDDLTSRSSLMEARVVQHLGVRSTAREAAEDVEEREGGVADGLQHDGEVAGSVAVVLDVGPAGVDDLDMAAVQSSVAVREPAELVESLRHSRHGCCVPREAQMVAEHLDDGRHAVADDFMHGRFPDAEFVRHLVVIRPLDQAVDRCSHSDRDGNAGPPFGVLLADMDFQAVGHPEEGFALHVQGLEPAVVVVRVHEERVEPDAAARLDPPAAIAASAAGGQHPGRAVQRAEPRVQAFLVGHSLHALVVVQRLPDLRHGHQHRLDGDHSSRGREDCQFALSDAPHVRRRSSPGSGLGARTSTRGIHSRLFFHAMAPRRNRLFSSSSLAPLFLCRCFSAI